MDGDDKLLFLRTSYNQLYLDKGFDVVKLGLAEGVADNQHELEVVFGISGDVMSSPFSAPFGGVWANGSATQAEYSTFCARLVAFARDKAVSRINVTLPAECYSSANVDLQLGAFVAAGFEVLYSDINHTIDLTRDFRSNLKRGARRSLTKAQSAGLSFVHADTDALRRRVYEIVRLNRQQKEKPLKLSYEDLGQVSTVTDTDYFLVTQDEKDIAGAVVFKLSTDVSQVIYWGNDVSYNSLNAIHFLAMHLWEYYRGRCKLLDIGPSSSAGVTDTGLAAFKESIGCERTLKHTLSWVGAN